MNKVFLSENKIFPVFEVGHHDFKIMQGITDSRMQSFFTVHIVLSGEGVFNINENSYKLSAGHIFLTPPKTLFSYYPNANNPWRYAWFAFREEAYLKLFESFGLTPKTPVYRTKRFLEIESILNKLFNETPESAAPLESAAAFFGVISVLTQENSCKASEINLPEYYVNKAIELVRVNYGDPNFNVHKLCKIMFISHSYLSRIFKSIKGETLSDFIIMMRYKKAAQLLANTDMTIKQVASSVGVKDEIHFYKQFKKIWGKTPDAYRKTVR